MWTCFAVNENECEARTQEVKGQKNGIQENGKRAS